ncbi:YdeI/OmpD-associated family protein [Desertihabitans aurantiacus]|uniref:YdeI/OmpD-associated family protein n=1 Tax=Desertihabitans aurantiacus TaxID=2282477 RepID=UPI0018E4E4A0|nr:YdeI/OmpD-associated family protein [Desertihabitans aurantiacus]
MPDDIATELERAGVRQHYDRRPAYQRNDYLAWVGRAKTADTRRRRIGQMLEELARGGVYMNMSHPPSRRHQE